ncbi:SseB family protein [Amnibacterium sp. CER49]|uniref:SseB family protein n=1 Tax=Amnibacterium sp. CER49 TaxID=3039161 RepID=UPI00244BD02B|nr:SseB family protein [Amnibacterium sp. CER49]MDH2444980.1 SseB family protein [Amnibacterium sp. CER49]
MSGTDSAGRPWAGRSFEASPWGADDGSAPPGFLAASDAFRAGQVGPEAVVDALRDARLLVPLLAGLAEAGEGHGGHVLDKKAELALVTVAGPDGRNVLPAFSSAEAMQRWNPAARPVPAPARQVALAAAADGTELVIVDPASATQFGLRRPALEALARDLPWLPAPRDPEVARALRSAAAGEDAVTAVRVTTDDPAATLEGAEVRVVVVLHSLLTQEALSALLGRLQERWRADPVVQRRVDSLAVGIEAALC